MCVFFLQKSLVISARNRWNPNENQKIFLEKSLGISNRNQRIWRFFICFATGNHWWFLQRIEKLLTVFTISNRNQALKHEESVLRPNGHRFWEVILWWFLAIVDRFYHIKSKSGTKTRRKRPTAKQTPVLRSHFVTIFGEFWPFLPYQIGIRH